MRPYDRAPDLTRRCVRLRVRVRRKSDMELLSPEDRYWVWQRVDDMLGISWNIPYNKILTMYIQRTLPPFVISLMKKARTDLTRMHAQGEGRLLRSTSTNRSDRSSIACSSCHSTKVRCHAGPWT